LLHQPDISTLRGLRDRALLAVLLGAGLRRSEAVSLTCRHFQKREGRWVIVDIRGKGSRMRSVPIPFWVKDAVDGWLATAGIRSGAVFRKILKNHRIAPHPLSHQSVHNIVKQYGILFDDGIAAHDLRRTFAKLARQGGSPIDQIQLTLGHASVATTERYLGTEQDLTDAPADHLGLEL
jgi:integrase